MEVGVRVRRVGGEVGRADDRLELDLDPRPRHRRLDDRLDVLARGVDGGLEDQLQALAVLRPHPVRPALPAGAVEDLVGLLDVELPAGGLRLEAGRRVEEVGGGLALAAVDLLLDGGPVGQERERGADGGVGEDRMGRLQARSLPVDLAPGIGQVAADELDATPGGDLDPPLAALLQPAEDVVLGLHVPRPVELPGLEHGPRGRDDVAAALHLHGVEERAVRDVVARIELRPDRVARLEVAVAVGARADRLEVGGRLAGPAAPEPFEHVLGDDHAAVPAEGVGPERHRLGEDEPHRVGVERLRALDGAVASRP